MAVLNAFIDESGTHPETPILSVAGFYGRKDQWEAFRQSWEPLSKGFHAKDCHKIFPDLCAAIEGSKIRGVLVTIGKETYKTCASEHFKSEVGNAYAVCVFQCVKEICAQANNAPVSFVLEQGQPNLRFVNHMLEDGTDSDGLPIAAVASAKKSDFIELHAADFLSHIASSIDKIWMQWVFDQGRHTVFHVTKEDLREGSLKVTKLICQARAARRKAKKTR